MGSKKEGKGQEKDQQEPVKDVESQSSKAGLDCDNLADTSAQVNNSKCLKRLYQFYQHNSKTVKR